MSCVYLCMYMYIQVLRGHACSDGLLSDYCDGNAYKIHPLFAQTSHSLELILYYDDVEVCNPLGSRAKTHKLGNICVRIHCVYTLLLIIAFFSFVLLHAWQPFSEVPILCTEHTVTNSPEVKSTCSVWS